MPLNELADQGTRFFIFGGKGGVGKTTCSSATGIYLAESGLKTLLISTDPAHSLSDSLGQPLGNDVRKVAGVGNLDAVEIDAEQSLRVFKKEYGEALLDILKTGTYLDEEDVSDVFSLTIPGLDEVMGMKRIMDFVEGEQYERYVLDTAPTGHALRLLFLPDLVDQWIKVLAKMRWKYRYVVSRLSGKQPAGEPDDFLLMMKKAVKRIGSLWKDAHRTAFVVVTLPELMAVRETERLLAELKGFGLLVRHGIVNHLIPARTGDCPFCEQTRREQGACLQVVRDKFADLTLTLIPREAGEIRGVPRLKALARLLFEGSREDAGATFVSGELAHG
ncbi:MAG: ArsA family ATPase [Nitrospinota bacterium]